MALTEKEELELLELEALEAGTASATPTNARDEIKAKHAKNVAAGAKAYKPSWTESFETGYKQGGSSGMGAALGVANVVGETAKGVGDAIVGAPETIKGIYKGVKQMGSELVDPAAYKNIAENPIVDLPGKIGAGLVTGVTEPLISPRTTGKALTEAAATAGAIKGIGAVAKASGPAAAYGARRLVSSVVKPSLKDQAFTKDPTGAVLKHRIVGNSIDDFSENVQGTIDNLSSQVDQKIAGSTAQTPVAEINSILDKDALRIANQIGISNEPSLLSFIEQTKNKIIKRFGEAGSLNDQQIHALRREIDNTIVKFTPDAVEQGINKTRYEFRSGLNNIIERGSPGVKALNHDVSSLLSAKEALGRRMATAERSPILGGPLDVAAEVAGSYSGAPGAYTLGRKVLGSTAVKTRGAQALESFAGRPSGRPSAAAQISQKGVSPEPVAPTPAPPSQPMPGTYFGPERRAGGLDPAVLEQGRSGAVQGGIELSERRNALSPQMTIGEAAMTGADVPLTQTLRYQGFPEAADFLENLLRNKQ